VQVVTQLGQVMQLLEGNATNGLDMLSDHLFGITVCLAADGRVEILVADSENYRVVALALDGSTARVVCGTGRQGNAAGELDFPGGLVVTAAGDLWVADQMNHRVCVFR
jgi:hypothetical protein